MNPKTIKYHIWKEKNPEKYKANVERQTQKRREHLEEYRVYSRNYYSKNKEKINSYNREYHKTHKECRRNTDFKANYGIDMSIYNKMYLEQDGRCFICNGKFPNHGKLGLVVDHNHETKVVRRLLCIKCNSLLGLSNDNPDLLQKAIDYLMEKTYGYREIL